LDLAKSRLSTYLNVTAPNDSIITVVRLYNGEITSTVAASGQIKDKTFKVKIIANGPGVYCILREK